MNNKTPDALLEQAALLFRTRGKEYSYNYLAMGDAMTTLFPEGVQLKTPRDHLRFHLLVLMMVKVTRYSFNWREGHPDSLKDLAVYTAMLEAVDGTHD
jgi:hypothetical protein